MIGLRAAAEKIPLHIDLRPFGDIGRRIVDALQHQRRLIELIRREHQIVVQNQVILAILRVYPSLGQRLVTNIRIRIVRILKRISDESVVRVAELMPKPNRKLGIARRRRNILVQISRGVGFTWRNGRIHNCIQVFFCAIKREQKPRRLALAHRPRDIPFIDPPLFIRLARRKRVLRVQRRVAKEKIELAMIFVRSRLGNDLHLPAARAIVPRRERVFVDVDLLHRRRRNRHPVRLHAIDHQPGARP